MSAAAVIVTSAVVAASTAVCAAPMVARRVAERRLASTCRRRRTLVLTYDDGPGSEATPRLLDLLAALEVRASFFALGRQAEANSAVLDRAVREGHEIGSHSYRHAHAWKCVPWFAVRDVTDGFRSLGRWVPADGLFRPPYGKLTPFTWAAARRRGARFAWWTHDSGDTWDEMPSAEQVVADVARDGGGVVLMHDFDRDPARVSYVLDLTRRLIEVARARGLRVVTLGELLRGAD